MHYSLDTGPHFLKGYSRLDYPQREHYLQSEQSKIRGSYHNLYCNLETICAYRGLIDNIFPTLLFLHTGNASKANNERR